MRYFQETNLSINCTRPAPHVFEAQHRESKNLRQVYISTAAAQPEQCTLTSCHIQKHDPQPTPPDQHLYTALSFPPFSTYCNFYAPLICLPPPRPPAAQCTHIDIDALVVQPGLHVAINRGLILQTCTFAHTRTDRVSKSNIIVHNYLSNHFSCLLYGFVQSFRLEPFRFNCADLNQLHTLFPLMSHQSSQVK